MSFGDKEFCRIILNYRVEFKHEENLCLFICIFKIGPIETVELMFIFDKKNWEKICNPRLVIEELLKNFISYDNWYFVPSFKIEKAPGFRFLFDSLIKFKLQKNMAAKHDETQNAFSINDDDIQQLSLILKSFVRIRENENFVVKVDFGKNEIRFEYYYNHIDHFSSEKGINYLNNFLKVAKFNKKKWLKPIVNVYHATFDYSEIICLKNFNFISRIEITR